MNNKIEIEIITAKHRTWHGPRAKREFSLIYAMRHTRTLISVRFGPGCDDEQRQAIACDYWIARALCRWILFAFTFDSSRSKFTRKFERVSLCECVCMCWHQSLSKLCAHVAEAINETHEKCREYSKSNEKLVCKFIMFIVHITIAAGKKQQQTSDLSISSKYWPYSSGLLLYVHGMRVSVAFRHTATGGVWSNKNNIFLSAIDSILSHSFT